MGPDQLLEALNSQGIETVDNQAMANSMESAEFASIMGEQGAEISSLMESQMPDANVAAPEVESVATAPSLMNDGFSLS